MSPLLFLIPTSAPALPPPQPVAALTSLTFPGLGLPQPPAPPSPPSASPAATLRGVGPYQLAPLGQRRPLPLPECSPPPSIHFSEDDNPSNASLFDGPFDLPDLSILSLLSTTRPSASFPCRRPSTGPTSNCSWSSPRPPSASSSLPLSLPPPSSTLFATHPRGWVIVFVDTERSCFVDGAGYPPSLRRTVGPDRVATMDDGPWAGRGYELIERRGDGRMGHWAVCTWEVAAMMMTGINGTATTDTRLGGARVELR